MIGVRGGRYPGIFCTSPHRRSRRGARFPPARLTGHREEKGRALGRRKGLSRLRAALKVVPFREYAKYPASLLHLLKMGRFANAALFLIWKGPFRILFVI